MTTKELRKIFPNLEAGIKVAPFTTFDIGGRAKFFLNITNKYELVEAVKKVKTHQIPFFVFSGGSNMVFPDRLPDKLIIRYTAKARVGTTVVIEGENIYAEAGVPLSSLVATSIKSGLAGLESLSGIPGTVGGAIFGNAGAYGQTISDHLVEIEIFDGREIKWVPASSGAFQYRTSMFKKKPWLVLGGKWQLEKGNTSELQKKSKEIIKTRNKKYAPGIKCPGSYFKNILADKLSKRVLSQIPADRIIGGKVPAGYLLEVAGVKGLKRGKICVPAHHANLILNTGGGKASDVLKVAETMKNKVKDHFGLLIEEEVRTSI